MLRRGLCQLQPLAGIQEEDAQHLLAALVRLALIRLPRLFAEREIYRGTLSRAAVDPRDILKHGLLYGASRIIVFLTHPSGVPTPSGDDLDFTRRLAEAADVIGLHLQDHLILGLGGRWVSLQARGAF